MSKTTLIEFPCLFPIKIIGINSDSFIKEISQITMQHFPNFCEDDLIQKISQKSSYLALTVTVFAENQEMLDAYYQEITQNAQVKMVL
ncbi:MAG: hypothetical protein CK426_04995 [Legionella sp.]|nr:MAG: hypothetical protein CK423_01485 [Legionella sp.]PJD98716.1 MAG: hypothetical protein CK426_04995 [Legionella sp.]